MESIKTILGGIGFLIFSMCCILLTNLSGLSYFSTPGIIALFIGSVLVVIGLFIDEKK
jgi:hypothetical protein